MNDSTKSRFRFTEDFDLHLGREVYGQNPYEDTKRWAIIQVNMIQITGKPVSITTLRERIENLVKKYLAKARSLAGKSGIEIAATELDDLLQQIADLKLEFEKKKKMKFIMHPSSAGQSKSSYLKGYDAREESCSIFIKSTNDDTDVPQDDYLQVEPQQHELEYIEDQDLNVIEIENSTIVENDEVQIISPSTLSKTETGTSLRERPLAQANIITPSRKRSKACLKESTLKYLLKKHEKQYDIRSRELVLQERKEILEEKKFEMDRQEQQKRLEIEERRLEMEEKRLKVELDIFVNQQELIKMLLEKESY